MHEQEINQEPSEPSYQKLKSMVKKHFDQKIGTHNIQPRNERIETGVLVNTRKWKNVSVERGLGDCYQWQAKGQCTKVFLQFPPR